MVSWNLCEEQTFNTWAIEAILHIVTIISWTGYWGRMLTPDYRGTEWGQESGGSVWAKTHECCSWKSLRAKVVFPFKWSWRPQGKEGRKEGIFLGDLGRRLSSKQQVGGLMVFLKSQGLAMSSSSVSCSRMIIKWSPLAAPLWTDPPVLLYLYLAFIPFFQWEVGSGLSLLWSMGSAGSNLESFLSLGLSALPAFVWSLRHCHVNK